MYSVFTTIPKNRFVINISCCHIKLWWRHSADINFHRQYKTMATWYCGPYSPDQVEERKVRKNRSIARFPGRGQQCNIIWDVQPPGGLYISLYSSSDRSAAFFFFFLQLQPLWASPSPSISSSLSPLSFFLSASTKFSSCAALTWFTEWTWSQTRKRGRKKRAVLYEDDKGKNCKRE